MRSDETGEILDDGTLPGTGVHRMLAQGASLSGHERNRVFLQVRDGERLRYVDMSPLSGLDALGDGRAFAWLDYDQDGDRDVVLTNANEPRVQLFNNQAMAAHTVLAIRLIGAKRDSTSTPKGPGNRDAIGARVEVVAEGVRRVLERRAGEGLAAQNASELLVGLGAAKSVSSVHVRWPSGRETRLDNPEVSPGKRTTLTLREPMSP